VPSKAEPDARASPGPPRWSSDPPKAGAPACGARTSGMGRLRNSRPASARASTTRAGVKTGATFEGRRDGLPSAYTNAEPSSAIVATRIS
jgi:hypothetical protein